MRARPSAVELLARLARVIGRRRWYLFGAQAVNVHGRPRMTADVDVTVELERRDVGSFVNRLGRAGFALRVADPAEFLEATNVLPFVHNPTGMPLDVVIAGSGLEEGFLDRAVPCELGGVVVPVISASDLVVTKILAGRSKDIEDAESVLRESRSNVDLGAIRELLAQIEEALGQSDLTPTFERIAAAVRKKRRRKTQPKRKARRPAKARKR